MTWGHFLGGSLRTTTPADSRELGCNYTPPLYKLHCLLHVLAVVLRRLIRFIHLDREIGVANRLTVEVLDAERFINQK